jgi:hypothetical protein
MKRLVSALAMGGLVSLASASNATAIPIYSDFIQAFQDVTFFGSGILTGAPDNGGAFLSNTFDPPTNLGFITARFTGGLGNGPGDDIVIYDCCGGGSPSASEFANVFVSTDGLAFTFLGAYGAGVNSFDLSGVFAGPVYFVKIVNTSSSDSPDIDAFQGNYEAEVVPEPTTLALLGAGLVALRARRRRTS